MAVLGSTSLTGCNSIPDFIAAGSLMLFQQTSAPTGWTKQTTHNDKALRVVSGAVSPGGTTAFSGVFASRSVPAGSVGNTTLSTPQIPSHNHAGASGTLNRFATVAPFFVAGQPGNPYVFGESPEYFNPSTNPQFTAANTFGGPPLTTGSTGGGGSHNHPFSAGSNMDFAVQYVDLIICSKN